MNSIQKIIWQTLWKIASVQFCITSDLLSLTKRNSLTCDLGGRKKGGLQKRKKNSYNLVYVYWVRARETGIQGREDISPFMLFFSNLMLKLYFQLHCNCIFKRPQFFNKSLHHDRFCFYPNPDYTLIWKPQWSMYRPLLSHFRCLSHKMQPPESFATATKH